MSEHPHTKTFPGTVRIVNRGPKLPTGAYEFPIRIEKVLDPKGRFTGTKVTVAAGGDLQYTQEHGKPGELPRHDVSVVRFTAAKPIDVDAELAKAKALEAAKQTIRDVEAATPKIEPASAGEPSPAEELEPPPAGRVYREDEEAPKR